MKNQRGFTLIEMLIVLLVISVLLLITIPNVTQHNKNIQEKGCDGLINMVQAQVSAYEIEHSSTPTVAQLEGAGYINEGLKCPNGNSFSITDGVVTLVVE